MATLSARSLVQIRPSGGNFYRPSFGSVHGVKNPSKPQNDYLNLLSDYVHEVEAWSNIHSSTKDWHILCVSICGEGLAMGNLNLEGFRFSMFISKSKLQLKTQHSYDISIITVIQFRCDLYCTVVSINLG